MRASRVRMDPDDGNGESTHAVKRDLENCERKSFQIFLVGCVLPPPLLSVSSGAREIEAKISRSGSGI